jgi:small subunit ribosomal protein S18
MKDCHFCQNKIKEIDYQDTDLLRRFLNPQGKILPARITGNCAKHQRKMAKAIKRARVAGLLPFTTK